MSLSQALNQFAQNLGRYPKVTEILNLNFNESFEIDLKYSK